MRPIAIGVTTAVILSLAPIGKGASAQSVLEGRLYGRVLTEDGESYEGFLRLGSAVNGVDALDALKEIPPEVLREAESLDPAFAAAQQEARSLIAFGMRITWDIDDEEDAFQAPTAIRVGHIRSMQPLERRRVQMGLRDGSEIILARPSGWAAQGWGVVEIDPGAGADGAAEREVRWAEIERIDFFGRPTPTRHPSQARLYGQVTTWDDGMLTGFITWDADEVLSGDVLDGRAEGVDHEIPFADISAIAFETDRSALVTRRDGRMLELRGTNDVNRANRGIVVHDPAFGRAIVQWESFKRLDLREPPAVESVTTPAPSAAIRGRAFAKDGRILEGEIRWGTDESSEWEMLHGWSGDTEFDIEFGAIALAERSGADALTVTLHDGRSWTLEGDEDAGTGYGGVFVQPEAGPRRLILWADLDRVEFHR